MKLEMSTFASQTSAQLVDKLTDLKTELFSIRQQKNLGTLKGNEIAMARKNVARCLTALRETRLIEAIEQYKDAKLLPKDMRAKLTKKLRSKLTRNQARSQTWAAQCREMRFKKKYYAYTEETIKAA